MTTYEEDIIEVWLNLREFFTIKNYPLVPRGKRGSRTRQESGEIDLMGIKNKGKRISEAIRVEVSTSVHGRFPFDKKEVQRLLKKFCIIPAQLKTKEYSNLLIARFFRTDAKKFLQKYGKYKGYKINKVIEKKDEKILKIFISGKKRIPPIIVRPFPVILNELISLFLEKELLGRNFTDPRMRGIQHYVIEKVKDRIRYYLEKNNNNTTKAWREVVKEYKISQNLRSQKEIKDLVRVMKGEGSI